MTVRAAFLIQETVTSRPPQVPNCRWTGCATPAIGGATGSEHDPDWVMPLCGYHLFPLSYVLWGRKSA